MGLGAGSGTGVADATIPATIYSPAGLTVSTSTISANVEAGTTKTISNGITVLNSLDPRVNIQINAGTAPDGSGKTMVQFEALVNTTGTGYSTLYVAQEALIAIVGFWGFLNLAFANNTNSTNSAVMGW